MRKLLTMASAGMLALAAAPIGSADADAASTRRTYDLKDFDRIAAVGPLRVIVAVGSGHSVGAEGAAETLDLYKVVVEDNVLKILPRDEVRWRELDWDHLVPATYRITLPELEAASIAGSGSMRVDRVAGARFAGSVAGSGKLDLATLDVGQASFSVAGSGDLVARGRVRRSRVSVAGSGRFEARELTSDRATISVAGSGDASLTVRDDTQVSVVGSGEVEIAGSPHCSVSRFGSGRVRCGAAS